MSLIESVCSYSSVAVVGMEKNTGKTECLKYVLEGCRRRGRRVGVTSIGIDGESCDQVTRTAKPEIVLSPDTLFATSEKFYHERHLCAEVLDLTTWQTALGRLVTARALTPGKVILSGPVSSGLLREVMAQLRSLGAETVLVDGALSRKSSASPAITEAMILSTGAALSPNIPELVRKTRFTYDLLQLPRTTLAGAAQLADRDKGLWAVGDDCDPIDLDIPSALLLDKEKLFRHGRRIFATGAVGDKLLDLMRMQPEVADTELIVKDFTRIFATPQSVRGYLQKGGRLTVLQRPRLLAICINPWSPAGFTVNADRLREELSTVVDVPVLNVREA